MYQKVIKENNETKIFKYIFTQQRNFVVADIAEKLNLSFPTAKRVVDILLKKNIVVEKSKIGEGVGRKAREYSFNSQFCYSIGIVITTKYIKMILVDASVEVIKKRLFLRKGEDFLNFLKECITSFLRFLTVSERKLLIGIGIAIEGIVDKEKDRVELSIKESFSLTELKNIEKELKIPIFIENESNLAGIAEGVIGLACNFNHFINLTLADSIGCSSFQKDSNGNLSFKAGRIYHMNINPDGNLCECGSKGCLGTYISNRALLYEFQKFYPEIEEFADIFQSRYLEENYGKLLLQNYIKHLAQGIKNLLFLSNPEKLIISGEICRYRQLIEKDLKENIYTENHIFYRGEETIVFSNMNENSSLIGASIFPIVDSLF